MGLYTCCHWKALYIGGEDDPPFTFTGQLDVNRIMTECIKGSVRLDSDWE